MMHADVMSCPQVDFGHAVRRDAQQNDDESRDAGFRQDIHPLYLFNFY